MLPEYHLAICGAGPAGFSPLVYLEENEALDTLLEKGVFVIDKESRIGAGSLKNYLITANSLGGVFLEIFRNNSPLYNYMKKQPSFFDLKEYEDSAPPLPLVGEFLSDIGKYIYGKIKGSKNSEVKLSTKLETIQLRKDGKYEVTYRTMLPPGKKQTIVAKNILFNIGGEQTSSPKFSLANRRGIICNSGVFLQGKEDGRILNLIQNTNKPINISIIGSSHSAFSCLYRLQNHFSLFNPDKSSIKLFHRSPIRLFYNSIAEAENDFYHVDAKTDVCKLSGRVNRYGGLRYDSFNLGKDVLNNEYEHIESFSISDVNDCQEIINSSDLLISCTGYTNKLVQILDPNGNEVQFLIDDQTLFTNYHCNPVLKSGGTMENFYTYGLGSGMKTSKENGGELNYRGRIDGVWVYQHEVSSRIAHLIEPTVKKH